MKSEYITASCGTALSALGTALQTEEVLRIVSLCLTILGSIISFIVIPILNWYKNAKRDDKITIDEIKEGAETLAHGIEQVQNSIDDKKD